MLIKPTIIPSSEQVLHDDGEEVRLDVPLVDLVQDHMRCLLQQSVEYSKG